MIDEKKIEEVAINASIEDTVKGRVREDYVISAMADHELGFQEGFKSGINWFKEHLWHPMSDKPEMGTEILIQRNMEVWHKHHSGLNVNSTTVHEFDFHDDWKSYEHDDEFKRWLYIEDLMKGEK